MWWVAMLAVVAAIPTVHGILNTTSLIVTPDGLTIYPCWQVNHREPDIEPSLMGLWYVIEIIQHRDDRKNHGSMVLDICPKLNLYRTSPTHIKLIWTEKAGDVHYNFKITDPENNGFWMVWSRQNGSMLNKVYEQFAGSVQVVQAQPSRMVLVFCANNITHYSIIMVRNITVPHDTRDIHQTLTGYGLPEASVRHTCKDPQLTGSAATRSSVAISTIMALLLLIISRLN